MSAGAAGPRSALRTLQGASGSRRGGGNHLLLDEGPGGPALLKLYRRRGSRWREAARQLSFRLVERRRGVTARERCRLERENLALWRAHGFDVPALLDRPLPEGCRPDAAQWLEYCPGPLLADWLGDADASPDERRREVARFAAALGERQQRALDAGEPRLVMKHASLKHVLLHAGRQVSFDLESVPAGSVPLPDALAGELAGFARSLLRSSPEAEREALGRVFIEAYGRPELLRRLVERGLGGRGPWRALRRRSDRRRRSFSRDDALRWLAARLDA